MGLYHQIMTLIIILVLAWAIIKTKADVTEIKELLEKNEERNRTVKKTH